MYNLRYGTLTEKGKSVNTLVSVKRFLVIAILLVAGLIGSAPTVKAETYTLDQCLGLAQKNRASIVRAKGAKRDARASVKRQFGRIFLPSVSMI